MNALNKQIKGSNLCGTKCSEKNTIIHPETNVRKVLLANDTSVTLEEWILSLTNENSEEHLSKYDNLLGWLRANYPIPSTEVLPATNDRLGGVKIGNDNRYLQVDNNGVISFNDSSLPLVDKANFTTLGGICLGNDSIMNRVNFVNTIIKGRFYIYDSKSNNLDYWCFPLIRDESYERTGIAIPQTLFTYTQTKSDWEETNPKSLSYILNKPSLSKVATSNDYNDLDNIPTGNTYKYIYTIHKEDFVKLDYLVDIITAEVISSIGNNKTIDIRILGSLKPDGGEGKVSYLDNIHKFINIQSENIRQILSERDVYTNIILNFSFSFDADTQITDIPFLTFDSESLQTHAAIIGDSNIAYNSVDNICTITIPKDNWCTITFNYSITKAKVDPNDTSKRYSIVLEYKVKDCKLNTVNL